MKLLFMNLLKSFASQVLNPDIITVIEYICSDMIVYLQIKVSTGILDDRCSHKKSCG